MKIPNTTFKNQNSVNNNNNNNSGVLECPFSNELHRRVDFILTLKNPTNIIKQTQVLINVRGQFIQNNYKTPSTFSPNTWVTFHMGEVCGTTAGWRPCQQSPRSEPRSPGYLSLAEHLMGPVPWQIPDQHNVTITSGV